MKQKNRTYVKSIAVVLTLMIALAPCLHSLSVYASLDSDDTQTTQAKEAITDDGQESNEEKTEPVKTEAPKQDPEPESADAASLAQETEPTATEKPTQKVRSLAQQPKAAAQNLSNGNSGGKYDVTWIHVDKNGNTQDRYTDYFQQNGSTVNVPKNLKSCVGWDFARAQVQPHANGFTMPNRNVTIYCKCNSTIVKESTYTIRYVDEDGNDLKPNQTKTTKESTVTEEALKIFGYNVKEEKQTLTLSNDPQKNIITFEYEKVSVQYEVQHYLENTSNNYKLHDTDQAEGKVNEKVTAQQKDYEGYIFNEGKSHRTVTIKEGENLTLKMYYDRAEFTVTYIDQEGKELKEVAYKYGQTVPYQESLNYLGKPPEDKFFQGWKSNEGTEYTANFEMPTKNLVLTAQYTNRPTVLYTVQYVDEHNNELDKESGTIFSGTLLERTAPETIVKDNALYILFDDTTKSLITDTQNNCLTFQYARVYTIEYTVRHIVDSDIFPEGTQEKVLKEETLYTDDATVTATAEDFFGYELSSQNKDAQTQTITLTHERGEKNNLITFKYKPKELVYQVEHYLKNLGGEETGYSLDQKNVTNGTTKIGDEVKGEPQTYPGYKYIADKSTSSATIETENDLVLKLYYDRIRSDVSYQLKEGTDLPNGSILPATTSHEFGESISVQLPEAPKGYTVNWTLADAEGIEGLDSDGFTMPAKSVTIIIEFTADSVDPTPIDPVDPNPIVPTPDPTPDPVVPTPDPTPSPIDPVTPNPDPTPGPVVPTPDTIAPTPNPTPGPGTQLPSTSVATPNAGTTVPGAVPATPAIAPAAPAAVPVAAPATTTLADDEVPLAAPDENDQGLETLEDSEVPLTGKLPAQWALVNLILAVFTVLVSAALLIGYFSRKRKDDDGEVKKKGIIRILSVLPALAAVILFFVTENITNPMVFTDQWTIWMALIAVLNVVVVFFSKKSEADEDDKEHYGVA